MSYQHDQRERARSEVRKLHSYGDQLVSITVPDSANVTQAADGTVFVEATIMLKPEGGDGDAPEL